jgi:mRNA interferase RelE/StbE
MADYAITFARSARKDLEALDAKVVSRIFPKIEALVGQPRPPNCRKLVGEESLWRIRVGDYRVIYNIDNERKLIDIIYVRHRSKAYS